MRITVVFEESRLALDVRPDDNVRSVKNIVNKRLLVDTMDDRKVGKYLEMRFGGAALQDGWVLQDLAVTSGSVIRCALKTVQKPQLQVLLNYSGEKLSITDEVNPITMRVGDLRSLLSRQLGIPVSIFRLSRTTSPTFDVTPSDDALPPPAGVHKSSAGRSTDMYDLNTLDYYGVEIGGTLRLDLWDGWKELILSAIADVMAWLCVLLGHDREVQKYFSWDRSVRHFQYQVLLYIAAHYGHMGLSTSMMKCGAKAHEPVGPYPSRKWCSDSEHREAVKCPVHVACARGHLALLRLFVKSSPLCFVATDQDGKTPIQIALRNRHRDCFEYLIVRQWGRKMGGDISIPVVVYCRVLQWCERAKASALLRYGTGKSSYRGKPPKAGALVGAGVLIDGFSKKPANSLAFDQMPKPALSPDRVLPAIAMAKRRFKAMRQRQSSSIISSSLRRVSTSSASSARNRLSSAQTAVSVRSSVSHSTSLASASATPVNDFSHERAMLNSGNKRSSRKKILPLPPPSSKDTERESVIGELPPRVLKPINNPGNGFNRKDSKISFQEVARSSDAKAPTAGLADELPALGSISYTPYSSFRSLPPAVKRKKAPAAAAKATRLPESGIPLPAKSLECQLKPFFYWSSYEAAENPVEETMRNYQSYRGDDARQHAVQCLTVTSEFTEKRWLQQLRLAVSLTRREVKKRVAGEMLSPSPSLLTSPPNPPRPIDVKN